LLQNTKFDQDRRIKLVGTVYDQELLKKIRELSYGYLHGHEVGGTNPSLLEALAMTNLNLLMDVSFNREVGSEGAVYFTKDTSNLASLIQLTDQFDEDQIRAIAHKAKDRIQQEYSWESIIQQYEELFMKEEYSFLEEIQGVSERKAIFNIN
jgi:rhamnosyltransferase